MTNISNFQITSNRKAACLRYGVLEVLISFLATISPLPVNIWQRPVHPGFLVILNQILGGDSQDPTLSKRMKIIIRRRAGDVGQNNDFNGEGIVFNIIGLSLVFLMCLNFLRFVLFYFLFLFMHCRELSHASHVLIFESTHELQVRWGTSSLPYDF